MNRKPIIDSVTILLCSRESSVVIDDDAFSTVGVDTVATSVAAAEDDESAMGAELGCVPAVVVWIEGDGLSVGA